MASQPISELDWVPVNSGSSEEEAVTYEQFLSPSGQQGQEQGQGSSSSSFCDLGKCLSGMTEASGKRDFWAHSQNPYLASVIQGAFEAITTPNYGIVQDQVTPTEGMANVI